MFGGKSKRDKYKIQFQLWVNEIEMGENACTNDKLLQKGENDD